MLDAIQLYKLWPQATPIKSNDNQELILELLKDGPRHWHDLCSVLTHMKTNSISYCLAELKKQGLIHAGKGKYKYYGLVKHALPDNKTEQDKIKQKILELLRAGHKTRGEILKEFPEVNRSTLTNILYQMRGKRGYTSMVILSESGYYRIRHEYR